MRGVDDVVVVGVQDSDLQPQVAGSTKVAGSNFEHRAICSRVAQWMRRMDGAEYFLPGHKLHRATCAVCMSRKHELAVWPLYGSGMHVDAHEWREAISSRAGFAGGSSSAVGRRSPFRLAAAHARRQHAQHVSARRARCAENDQPHLPLPISGWFSRLSIARLVPRVS